MTLLNKNLIRRRMSIFLLLTGNVEKSSDFGDYGIRAIREIRDENQNRGVASGTNDANAKGGMTVTKYSDFAAKFYCFLLTLYTGLCFEAAVDGSYVMDEKGEKEEGGKNK